MTGEKRIYNADLLEAIHSLDKKLGEHLVYCKGQWKKINELDKDIYGNGNGIKHQNKILYQKYLEEKEEQKEEEGDSRKSWIDVRTAIITFILITISQYVLSLDWPLILTP